MNYDPNEPLFAMLQSFGGTKEHALTEAEMPTHSHSYVRPVSNGSASGSAISHPDGPLVSSNTGITGGNQPHNNLQPYFVIVTLIKL